MWFRHPRPRCLPGAVPRWGSTRMNSSSTPMVGGLLDGVGRVSAEGAAGSSEARVVSGAVQVLGGGASIPFSVPTRRVG